MRVKELFIQNETYQLPIDEYKRFKERKDKCSGNPMCINNLKYDAESFIAKYAKSHASKIENGEESGFIVDNSPDIITKTNTEGQKKLDYIALIGLAAVFVLAVLAVKEKSITYGIASIVVAYFVYQNKKSK